MKRLMVAALAAALFTVVGCQKNQGQSQGGSGQDPKMMANDACSHCPGVQQANAEGKCSSCGMAVKDPNMMSADACSKCPGVQPASADGHCAECEAKKSGGATGGATGDNAGQPAQ